MDAMIIGYPSVVQDPHPSRQKSICVAVPVRLEAGGKELILPCLFDTDVSYHALPGILPGNRIHVEGLHPLGYVMALAEVAKPV